MNLRKAWPDDGGHSRTGQHVGLYGHEAASDPDVDAGKMEKVLDMAYGLRASGQTSIPTMAEMKPELPVIDKRGKIIITDARTIKPGDPVHGLWALGRYRRSDNAYSDKIWLCPDFPDWQPSLILRDRYGRPEPYRGHSEESEMASTGYLWAKTMSGLLAPVLAMGKRYTAGLLNLRFNGEMITERLVAILGRYLRSRRNAS